MAEEINKTYTSNSLYNDSTGVIAFAEQLKQELINWANYQHVTEELGQNRPDLQSELNNLFLSVYERFLTFLNDADASEEAINTWKEIENFLADYTDEKTLASIVAELNNKIESRLTVPLESTTGSSTTSTMTQKAITDSIDASTTFTTGESVDNIGIDDEPTANSNNLVKSKAVYNAIQAIKNAGYIFIGVATPETNPGTPDQKVFYIASQSGVYQYFNSGFLVNAGEIGIFRYDTSWHNDILKVGKDYDNDISNLNTWVFSKLNFIKGQINSSTGSIITSETRAYSGFFKTPTKITFSSNIKVSGRFYDKNGNYQTYNEWTTREYTPDINYPLMRLVVSYNDDSSITDASIFDSLVIINGALQQIDELISQIKDIKMEDVNFVLGTISTNDGRDESSTTRVKMPQYFTYTPKLTILCNSNYKISFRWYDENKIYISTTVSWRTGEISVDSFLPTNGVYFRIVGAYSNDSQISDVSDFDENIFVKKQINILVSDLYENNKKNIQDIDDIKSDITNLDEHISDVENSLAYDLEKNFVLGTIELNGSERSNNKRVRSSIYFPIANKIVYCNSDYRYAYRWYNANYEFISYTVNWKTEKTKAEQEAAPNAAYFRIVGAYSNDGVITDVTEFETNIIVNGNIQEQVEKNTQDIESILPRIGSVTPYSSISSVGNSTILCSKEHTFNDGTSPLNEWYLLGSPHDNKLYISRDMQNRSYIATFDGNIDYYSFGVLSNGDIIAVRLASSLSSGGSDSNRQNPFIFKASENWAIQHTIDFGNNLKPCGWLENAGFRNLPDGSTLLCEYTRITVATANCWKITGDASDISNWVVTKSFILSGEPDAGFKHCHMIAHDHFTGIVYLATGDDNIGAMVFASMDNGETWTQLREASETWCRMLMMSFTKDYIYWGQDTPGLHYFFRASRDSNGILDYTTAIKYVVIPEADGYFATYGQSYIPEYNACLLLDRQDSTASGQIMPIRIIDLTTGTIETIGNLTCTDAESGNIGFRTLFSEWYPIDGLIKIGFGLGSYSVAANKNKVCGNQWPINNGKNSVNNLWMKVAKDGDKWSLKFGTYYL